MAGCRSKQRIRKRDETRREEREREREINSEFNKPKLKWRGEIKKQEKRTQNILRSYKRGNEVVEGCVENLEKSIKYIIRNSNDIDSLKNVSLYFNDRRAL